MVERAARRQPGTASEFGQPQRQTPEIVRARETVPKKPEKPAKLELVPTPLEYSLERFTYKPGQEVELLADDGKPETWAIVDVSPEDNEVFLKRSGDKAKIPSLEVLNQTELAIEQATQPLVQAAAELWDEVLNGYSETSGTLTSADSFKEQMSKHKGRVLRATALDVFENYPDILQSKNPDALKLVLDKTLSKYFIQESAKNRQKDPRHKAAEDLEAVAKHCTALAQVRYATNELRGSAAANEILHTKLGVLTHDNNLDPELTVINPLLYEGHSEVEVVDKSQEVTELHAELDKSQELSVPSEKSTSKKRDLLSKNERLPSYEEAQAKSVEAWEHLKRMVASAKQQLTFHDPNSFRMAEIQRAIEKAYGEALSADVTLNDARKRVGLETGAQLSQEEYFGWKATLDEWANQPGTKAAPKDKIRKPREPVFVEPRSPKPSAPAKLSRPARWVDKVVGFFGL